MDGFNNHMKEKRTRLSIWMISTIVIALLLIISIFTNGFGITSITGATTVDIEEKVKEYIEENLVEPGTEVEVKNAEEENGLWKLTISIGGQEFDSYVSKDGELLFPSMIDMTKEVPKLSQQTQQQTGVEYSSEDIKKIESFVSCLEKKGFKIYGANWCGWTKKLVVDAFGGFDVVEPIYVECTEEKELCDSEGIKGFPTIKINGKLYEGGRTFEGFAKETGCEAPDVETQVSSSEEASC